MNTQPRHPWPDFLTHRNLYSQSPEERYRASLEYGENNPHQHFNWPFGCWGAANAWLVLLGPSPGRQDRGTDARPSGQSVRKWDQYPKIGKDTGSVQFTGNVSRNRRWKALWQAGFGSISHSEIPEKLTAVINLDGGNISNASSISNSVLIAACPDTCERLQEAKPRIVIVLSWKAWHPINKFFEKKFKSAPIYPPAFNSYGKPLHAFSVKLGNEIPFNTYFIKSPQHPSMPFFKIGKHDTAVKETIDWIYNNFGIQ